MENDKSVINIGNLSENLDFDKLAQDVANMTDAERAEIKNKVRNTIEAAVKK